MAATAATADTERLVAYTQLGGPDHASAPAAATAAPRPAPRTPQSPPPVESKFVELEITGAPEGTEVLGPTGPIGAAPGRVQLPRGEEKVLLTFRAPGYKPETREVEPRADGRLEVTLEAAPAEHSLAAGDRSSGKKKHGGAGKKKSGDGAGDKPGSDDKNSIEDPF